MGFLNTANDMADNSMKLLSDVLDSKFTTYLQGNGTPTLVTYYNIDDTLSTVDMGTYTVDEVLGGDSPLRYNRIENFPVFGLNDILPSIEMIEGNLMDMSLDKEVIILPNTIKPTPLDILIYRFNNGSTVTFKVTEFELSSIKNNSYYKLSLSLKDINDNDTVNKVESQTVKGFTARLETIGTQDNCIIEDKIYDEITTIESTIKYIIEEYTTLFYDKRYNCLLLRNSKFSGYPIYDPYLTTFVIKNNILDNYSDYIVLCNYDNRPEIDKIYKLSMYRYLELRNIAHMELMVVAPTSFSNLDSNPFYYYGEESVFTIDLMKKCDCGTPIYGNQELIESIIYNKIPDKKSLPSRQSQDVMVDKEKPPILYEREPLNKVDIFDNSELRTNFDRPDNAKEYPEPVHVDVHYLMSPQDIENIFDNMDNDKYADDINMSESTSYNINTPNYDEVVPVLPTKDNNINDLSKWNSKYDDKVLSNEDLDDIYDESMDDEYDKINIPEPPVDNNEHPESVILSPYYLNFIKDYFLHESLYELFSVEDIHNLNIMEINYNETDFIHIPMLIYVLRKYLEYLVNNK